MVAKDANLVDPEALQTMLPRFIVDVDAAVTHTINENQCVATAIQHQLLSPRFNIFFSQFKFLYGMWACFTNHRL